MKRTAGNGQTTVSKCEPRRKLQRIRKCLVCRAQINCTDGQLIATKNPFGDVEQINWDIPADLESFKPVAAVWEDTAQV